METTEKVTLPSSSADDVDNHWELADFFLDRIASKVKDNGFLLSIPQVRDGFL